MFRKLVSKFIEPTATTGEWVSEHELHFWHDDPPFAVKYAIEKMTVTLLGRDTADTQRLRYSGLLPGGGQTREIRLRFDAVIDLRKLYALRARQSSPRRWVSEEAHRQAADRALAFWRGQLHVAGRDIAWSQASAAGYAQCMRHSNGREFARNDYGEPPLLSETYADDAAMLRCLRAFYDGDSRRPHHPHRPPELEVWRFIRNRLSPRHA